MEDLDPMVSRPDIAAGQLRDLRLLGIDWDGPVVYQSDRRTHYAEAVARLKADDRTYPCFCTRREIRDAAAAPNGPPLPDGAYPGTCRSLTRQQQRQLEADGRRPALRFRSDGELVSFVDALCGVAEATVDDLVLVRNDGVFAYNLAVVVDDEAAGVEQVVRADDLLLSTPRQIALGRQLGCRPLRYAHVPLVLGPDGERLAKRHGATSMGDLVDRGWGPAAVVGRLTQSLGLTNEPVPDLYELLPLFSPAHLPNLPWQLTQQDLSALPTDCP